MSGSETDLGEDHFGLIGGGMAVMRVVAFTQSAHFLDNKLYGAISRAP